MTKAFFSTPLLLAVATASLLSKSTVETCLQSDSELNCESKLVLLVDLAQNQELEDEAYIFKVNETDDMMSLKDSVYIRLAKSTPTYQYPLVYKKDFPFYAYERVINTGIGECFAGASDDYPTCGW
jgi:hypothetical protein